MLQTNYNMFWTQYHFLLLQQWRECPSKPLCISSCVSLCRFYSLSQLPALERITQQSWHSFVRADRCNTKFLGVQRRHLKGWCTLIIKLIVFPVHRITEPHQNITRGDSPTSPNSCAQALSLSQERISSLCSHETFYVPVCACCPCPVARYH